MGLFRRSSSATQSSGQSVASGSTAPSSVSSKSGKVKAKDLSFNSPPSASPNSRLLALASPPATDNNGGLGRRSSTSAGKKAPAVEEESSATESEDASESESEQEPEAPEQQQRTPKKSWSDSATGAVAAVAATAGAAGAAAAGAVGLNGASPSNGAAQAEAEESDDGSVSGSESSGDDEPAPAAVAAALRKTSASSRGSATGAKSGGLTKSELDKLAAASAQDGSRRGSNSSSRASRTAAKQGFVSHYETESPTEIGSEASSRLEESSGGSTESEDPSDDDDRFSSASEDETDTGESAEVPPKKPLPRSMGSIGAAQAKKRGSVNNKAGNQAKKGTSKAALLAQEAMDRQLPRRKPLGKPLKDLTKEDVDLTEQDIKDDIKDIWTAMHLFMNSRMIEAEDICLSAADHRLYFSVGFSLIQCIKSLMTFEPEDLEAAISCCKDSIMITQLLRKKDHGMLEGIGRLAKGSTSVASIKGMTLVQRHAELVYAECTLLKAVIGIIYSGDFIAFLKEALNMRNAYAIYRTLAKYVEVQDAAHGGGEDPSIDQDFRSGVFLGNGLISLILSVLPASVLKIMEVFGFTGDREYALRTLMAAGKWTPGEREPGLEPSKEGIRRQVCDMALLMHHLVIASYLPVTGVDIHTADNILHYNLDRYPQGVFFLYFSGRLYSTQTLGEKAAKHFHMAISAQREYVQLQHICQWDLGLVSLAMGEYKKGFECFNILDKESNWSKAIYAYAKGVTLYEQGHDHEGATEILKSVPDLMQRIAGKSIPLEKFVARRAQKYVSQGNRLLCPGVELAYVLNCLGMSPRFALFETHLDRVSVALKELHGVKDHKKYGNGDEYWDDYCLAHLLRGIILRFIAYPEAHTRPRPDQSPIPKKEAGEQAMISFNNVLKHGRDLIHDHFLVWFAHYEMGQLYRFMGQYQDAAAQYQIVMSGKNLEYNKKTKGKVSLQNMAVLRANCGLGAMREDGKI